MPQEAKQKPAIRIRKPRRFIIGWPAFSSSEAPHEAPCSRAREERLWSGTLAYFAAGEFVDAGAAPPSSAFLQPTSARQTANTNNENTFIVNFC